MWINSAEYAAGELDRTVPLGELLVRSSVVSRNDLQTAQPARCGYPMVDVDRFPVEAEAASRLPLSIAQRLPALPCCCKGGRLVVAFEDPSSRAQIDEGRIQRRVQVVPVPASCGSRRHDAVFSVCQKLGLDNPGSSGRRRRIWTTEAESSGASCVADLELGAGRHRSGFRWARSSRATTRWCAWSIR